MSLFGVKDKELDGIVNSIKVDLSNNYKDNAVENIQKLKNTLDQRKKSGTVKDKVYDHYVKMLHDFENDVKDFKRTY